MLDRVSNHNNRLPNVCVPGKGSICYRTKDTHNWKLTEAYRGEVKLSVYMNSGLLTIHVIQGRHLETKYGPTCTSYIKVSLVPEDDQNVTCCTDVIPENNNPLFDEKFSFELLPEDAQKRVLISAYDVNPQSGSDELLGCMSFGIHKIATKCAYIDGWYYLMSEDLGRRKHSQVSSRRHEETPPQRHLTDISNNTTVTFETIPIVVRRGTSGYGFTLTGDCPTSVCRLQQGGQAEKAGLRSGDVIVRINREKVYMSSIEGMARIIKHCSRKVSLEIQRPHNLQSPPSHVSPWFPSYTDLDSSTSSSSDEDGESSMSGGWWDQGDKENNPHPYLPVRSTRRQ